MSGIGHALTGLALAMLAGTAMAEPRVVETTVIGPFSGHDAKFHPANLAPHKIEYYGTDLGFTYEHQGKLQARRSRTPASASVAAARSPTALRRGA